MKRSGIDAATVAGYIYDLESENAWMRDRCKDMIDISDLKTPDFRVEKRSNFGV